jgi:4-hydroxy-tetrahydrodipicolinate synthase
MIGGIWAAVLTPINEKFSPDVATAVPYYRELLACGCDGINVLGTTGEAMSFNGDQRIAFMESIGASGLPMDRVMAGSGAASLADSVRQTRAAFDCGFAAALVMPPFFFRDSGDDGIAAFFDALLAQANPPQKGIVLYNFPRMSGITFHASLVDRLVDEFPGIIAGMKDSSNDAQLQTKVLARHPEFAMFPGSESGLLAAKARGAMGCISGTVALWPEFARSVFTNDAVTQDKLLTKARAALDGTALIPAMRHLTATLRNDPAWERAMPPLTALAPAQQRDLDRRLAPFRSVTGLPRWDSDLRQV